MQFDPSRHSVYYPRPPHSAICRATDLALLILKYAEAQLPHYPRPSKVITSQYMQQMLQIEHDIFPRHRVHGTVASKQCLREVITSYFILDLLYCPNNKPLPKGKAVLLPAPLKSVYNLSIPVPVQLSPHSFSTYILPGCNIHPSFLLHCTRWFHCSPIHTQLRRDDCHIAQHTHSL